MATLDHLLHLPDQIDRIEMLVRRCDLRLKNMETYMSAAMDRLREDVAAQKTVTSSVLTLLNDISNKLKDAVANEDTTAIEAISADLEANTKSLSDAVLANTPAQGTEPPA